MPRTMQETKVNHVVRYVDGVRLDVANAATTAAVSGTSDGTYSTNEQNMLTDLQTQLNLLRTRLIALGIAV